jgi:phenylalanyl-tRNA synthetase alpha subunit
MKTSLRCPALRYEIDDIRLFFDNDLRFLQQFAGLPGR